MVKRVWSTNNVMRFSMMPFGPVAISAVDGDAIGIFIADAANKFVGAIDETAATNEADAKLCGPCEYPELVLGNGERRACCNCDLLGKFDNLTLFLQVERMCGGEKRNH